MPRRRTSARPRLRNVPVTSSALIVIGKPPRERAPRQPGTRPPRTRGPSTLLSAERARQFPPAGVGYSVLP
jgi:hypothetical protein